MEEIKTIRLGMDAPAVSESPTPNIKGTEYEKELAGIQTVRNRDEAAKARDRAKFLEYYKTALFLGEDLPSDDEARELDVYEEVKQMRIDAALARPFIDSIYDAEEMEASTKKHYGGTRTAFLGKI